MSRRLTSGVFVVTLAWCVAACGKQMQRIETEVNDVNARTQTLEQGQKDLAEQVDSIVKMLESEGLTSDEERADLLARFSAMERSVLQLEARVEEQEALLQRIYAAIDVLAKSGGTGSAAGGAVAGLAAGAMLATAGADSAAADSVGVGTTVAPGGDVAAGALLGAGVGGAVAEGGGGSPGADVYDAAFRDFTRGSYSLARAGFQEFLSRFPENDLSDNAAYWIGETFYAQGNYREALRQFETVLRQYPDGDILAAATLKVANCYNELDETSRAVEHYRQLIEEYPESDEAFIARHKLTELGADP